MRNLKITSPGPVEGRANTIMYSFLIISNCYTYVRVPLSHTSAYIFGDK